MGWITEKQKQASLENWALANLKAAERGMRMLGHRYQPYELMIMNLIREFNEKREAMRKERNKK